MGDILLLIVFLDTGGRRVTRPSVQTRRMDRGGTTYSSNILTSAIANEVSNQLCNSIIRRYVGLLNVVMVAEQIAKMIR